MISKARRLEDKLVERMFDLLHEMSADSSIELKWRHRIEELLEQYDELTGPVPNDDENWGIG